MYENTGLHNYECTNALVCMLKFAFKYDHDKTYTFD